MRGLIQRLKYGRVSTDTSLKVLSCCVHKVLPNESPHKHISWGASTLHIKELHCSPVYLGKNTRKVKKRNPLKNNKKITGPNVSVYNEMTIKELANALEKDTDHVYDVLDMIPGTRQFDHDNAILDRLTIINVVKKSGRKPVVVGRNNKNEEPVNKDIVKQPPPNPSDLTRRPPVVTIMGHVDHGKTTLLDQLRKSNIVDREFGGITQHIGAFLVKLDSGESICFLDTPGHAAFSAMRSRGANLTDIVVLMVAADDGVMQQTQESIQHAKQSGVPIIVAINKIDKDNADVERSKYMLMEQDIVLEEFGGEVQAVPISALKGTNLQQLQEAIITQADMMELTGDAKGLVEARVVEARHDAKIGRLVTAVIERGTLKRGDFLVAGTSLCKVRAMYDEFRKPLQSVGPGQPVEIWGFKETPSAGEEILQVKSESEGKSVISWRKGEAFRLKQEADAEVINERREEHTKEYREALLARRAQGLYRARRTGPPPKAIVEEKEPQLSILLKADVDGSVEAIMDTLQTYNNRKCRLDVIDFGVGSVTDSDIDLAATFGGEVIAFNVDLPVKIANRAKDEGVTIYQSNIIYRLFDHLKEELNARLPKLYVDDVKGEAKVLQVFQVTLPNKKKSWVAGCRCIEGNISKKLGVKVIRDDETIYTGKISMLKNFKVEVETIRSGQECGICLDNSEVKFEPHDVIISYDVKEVDDEIEWNLGF